MVTHRSAGETPGNYWMRAVKRKTVAYILNCSDMARFSEGMRYDQLEYAPARNWGKVDGLYMLVLT